MNDITILFDIITLNGSETQDKASISSVLITSLIKSTTDRLWISVLFITSCWTYFQSHRLSVWNQPLSLWRTVGRISNRVCELHKRMRPQPVWCAAQSSLSSACSPDPVLVSRFIISVGEIFEAASLCLEEHQQKDCRIFLARLVKIKCPNQSFVLWNKS